MKKTFTSGILLLLLLLGSKQQLAAQALDPTFQPTTLKVPYIGSVTNNTIVSPPMQAVRLANNKLLVAGGFDFSNDVLASKIQRLNADGSNDTSFNPGGIGANGFIGALLALPDGSSLIAGGFTTYNGRPATTIARLTPNGALDPAFSSAAVGATVRQITVLALQPNGKILVGSVTSDLYGQPTGGLVRLNADGSLDSSFNPGAGAQSDNPQFIGSASVRSLLVLPDGKILVGGTFLRFNNQPASNLVRLNADGSRDASFSTGTGFASTDPGTVPGVRALVLQPDGNVLVGGAFQTYNGKPSAGLVRLQPDGALDTTLNLGTSFAPVSSISSIWLENDGRIVAAGFFNDYNGIRRPRLARLSSAGTLDSGFGSAVGANSTIRFVLGVGNGEYVVLGPFTKYQDMDRTGLAYLDAAGILKEDFAPVFASRGRVEAVSSLANGALLVQGDIREFNGQVLNGPFNQVRRVKADGTLDPSYETTATSIRGGLADGTFYALEGLVREQFQLQRILPSGQADNAFTSSLFKITASMPTQADAEGVATLPDGRAVVFGSFTSVGGNARNGIVRLLANGAIDNSFVPPAGTGPRAFSNVLVQADGKLVVVYFQNDAGANGGTFVERLNADGTPDPTFSIGAGAGPGSFFKVLIQRNGQLLVSGDFSTFNGQAAPGLVRLLANGAVDNTFAATVADYRPQAVQASGHILALTGSYGDQKLLRLNPNGRLDQTFTPVPLPQALFVGEDFLTGLTLQTNDTKIMLWGSFRSVLGEKRIGLARLTNPAVATGVAAARATLPVEVYPNPAGQAFRVVVPKTAGPLSATLVDALGREVRRYQWTTGPKEATVAVDNLPAGVYTLRLMGPEALYVQRIVVNH